MRFGTGLQVKANSTLTSGEKSAKKVKKSDMTTVFDHKIDEILKFSSVTTLYTPLAI